MVFITRKGVLKRLQLVALAFLQYANITSSLFTGYIKTKVCNSFIRVLYQRFRSSRVLCSMLAVPVLFWTERLLLGSIRAILTVQSASVTTGTTKTLTFHNFSVFSFSSWYLSSLLCSFLLMLQSLGSLHLSPLPFSVDYQTHQILIS